MKRRQITEKVSQKFLIDLLEPFHPTLKKDEKIVNLYIEADSEKFDITYYIVKEV